MGGTEPCLRVRENIAELRVACSKSGCKFVGWGMLGI